MTGGQWMRSLHAFFRVLSSGTCSVFLFHKLPRSLIPLAPRELDLAIGTRVIDAAQALFRLFPLADAVAALRFGERLPPRAACITFDDGYADWVQCIAPALQGRRLHITFFATTGIFKGHALWRERILPAVSVAPEQLYELHVEDAGLQRLLLSTQDERRDCVVRLGARLKYMALGQREQLLGQLEAVCEVKPGAVDVMSVYDFRDLPEASASAIRPPTQSFRIAAPTRLTAGSPGARSTRRG